MIRSFIVSSSFAFLLAAGTPVVAATVAFAGTIRNDTPPPGPSPLCDPGQVRIAFSPANAVAIGQSNLGGFGVTQAHCLTPPPTSYSGGLFEFAFSAGNVLTGTYSGFFEPSVNPAILASTVNFVATGGTGRFAGASGAIQGLGTLDRSVPRSLNNLALTGTLNLPAVPEPASWAMLVTGFGLAGASMRRRRVVRPI